MVALGEVSTSKHETSCRKILPECQECSIYRHSSATTLPNATMFSPHLDLYNIQASNVQNQSPKRQEPCSSIQLTKPPHSRVKNDSRLSLRAESRFRLCSSMQCIILTPFYTCVVFSQSFRLVSLSFLVASSYVVRVSYETLPPLCL